MKIVYEIENVKYRRFTTTKREALAMAYDLSQIYRLRSFSWHNDLIFCRAYDSAEEVGKCTTMEILEIY